MKIDLSDAARERIDDLIRAIDANTAALERANDQRYFDTNGHQDRGIDVAAVRSAIRSRDNGPRG